MTAPLPGSRWCAVRGAAVSCRQTRRGIDGRDAGQQRRVVVGVKHRRDQAGPGDRADAVSGGRDGHGPPAPMPCDAPVIIATFCSENMTVLLIDSPMAAERLVNGVRA